MLLFFLLGPHRIEDPIERRRFLGQTALGAAVAAAVAGAGALVSRIKPDAARSLKLRPPGALKGDDFYDACTRCFQCASACPNDCIRFYEISAGSKKALTPFIKARRRGCTLCGACTDACPTNALKPFTVTREGWVASVDMGKAHVNKSMCFSYHGRTCGACYRACPLAGEAMTIGMFETPIVHPEACVGCGLCEQACLHLPQAIRVIPRENLENEA